jgi:hypothetical protein
VKQGLPISTLRDWEREILAQGNALICTPNPVHFEQVDAEQGLIPKRVRLFDLSSSVEA